MTKTFESIWHNPETGVDIVVARGSSEEYVRNIAQVSQFVPYTIREYQTPDNIRADYRKWRKENNNRKPNRVIVKMRWEDGDNTEKGYQIDTIGIAPENYWIDHDNAAILFWVSTIPGLIDLMQPGNGSDFVVDEVLEFYKV